MAEGCPGVAPQTLTADNLIDGGLISHLTDLKEGKLDTVHCQRSNSSPRPNLPTHLL